MTTNFDYYARSHHDHEHGHDHERDHEHEAPNPANEQDNGPPGEYEIMSRAMQELLEAKGIITAEQVRKRMEQFDEEFPYRGAQVVARAWVDPAFKARLLADCRAATAELGIDIGQIAEFKVVENTPETHNVIVCTLCSCYPKLLLGVPPAWYKSLAYRSRTVVDPRGVLAEFGVKVPKGQEVRVHDSTADLRYIVLPMRPKGTDRMSETELAGLVTRDCMIGTAVPAMPKNAAGAH